MKSCSAPFSLEWFHLNKQARKHDVLHARLSCSRFNANKQTQPNFHWAMLNRVYYYTSVLISILLQFLLRWWLEIVSHKRLFCFGNISSLCTENTLTTHSVANIPFGPMDQSFFVTCYFTLTWACSLFKHFSHHRNVMTYARI